MHLPHNNNAQKHQHKAIVMLPNAVTNPISSIKASMWQRAPSAFQTQMDFRTCGTRQPSVADTPTKCFSTPRKEHTNTTKYAYTYDICIYTGEWRKNGRLAVTAACVSDVKHAFAEASYTSSQPTNHSARQPESGPPHALAERAILHPHIHAKWTWSLDARVFRMCWCRAAVAAASDNCQLARFSHVFATICIKLYLLSNKVRMNGISTNLVKMSTN